MGIIEYIDKNKSEFGTQGSEFIIKVEHDFEADIEGKTERIIVGYIRPNNRDGDTVNWIECGGKLVLMPTEEELENIVIPESLSAEEVWKRIKQNPELTNIKTP